MSRRSEEVRVLQITGRRPTLVMSHKGCPLREKGDGARGRGGTHGLERAAQRRRAAGRPSLTRCGLAPGPAGGEAFAAAPGTQRAADFRPARSPRLRATRFPAAPARDCAPTPTAGFWELWFFVCFFFLLLSEQVP